MEGNEPKGDPPDKGNPAMEKIETWQIGSERPPPHVDEEIKPKREQPKLEFQQQEKHIESTQTTPESGDGKGNIPESPDQLIVTVSHEQKRDTKERKNIEEAKPS
ncbi:hypothetical protein JTB14_031464 [Gonioctena quinquepunctata]|nr:hypothetical protein JTB14_031464 [Gonioctena quinquepunctata]